MAAPADGSSTVFEPDKKTAPTRDKVSVLRKYRLTLAAAQRRGSCLPTLQLTPKPGTRTPGPVLIRIIVRRSSPDESSRKISEYSPSYCRRKGCEQSAKF